MADKTGIEWTDATWNPVTGCAKVSQGCKHCYAEREWPRMTKLVPAYAGRDFTDVRTHADRLDQPLRWKRPRKVFVNSMSDLFHPDVPDEFIDRVFAVMALAPQHVFQVLTKRPERMRDYLSSADVVQRVIHQAFKLDCEAGAWMNADHNIGGYKIMPLPNVWLGVSVEDQAAADERIPLLLDTPAAVRWISAEPLLGPVDASRYMWPVHARWPAKYESPEEAKAAGEEVTYHRQGLVGAWCKFIDWVVVGGESGPKARPMQGDWARSLRNQCAISGVPFLFKQWGEWIDGDQADSNANDKLWAKRSHFDMLDAGLIAKIPEKPVGPPFFGCDYTVRLGKKAAGRLLDGVTHDGYPGAVNA